MGIEKYMARSTWERLKAFADTKPTPFLVFDLRSLEAKYREMQEQFPNAAIYYAIKANPARPILKRLIELGSCFDVASRYELDLVLELGCPPERMSFGNTIKKAADIAYFYQRGVRLYATDSELDLENLARHAPGSRVYVRILNEGDRTADWPLSRKFGCHNELAYSLLIRAKEVGLDPAGISFHVGSQQRDIGAWDAAIAKASTLYYRLLEERGIKLQLLNLGGGLPAHYLSKAHNISTYAREIYRFLQEDFGQDMPSLIFEPGRSLVADLGVVVSEVVNVARKHKNDLYRWVYLDTGLFGGLMETMGEAIKYPIYTDQTLDQTLPADLEEEVILAGPTCDSMDVMYQNFKYSLPLELRPGNRVYFFTAGAYTTTYSCVAFNGFPPLAEYYVE